MLHANSLRILAVGASVLVTAVVIMGVVVVGSPSGQRALSRDIQRVNDLSMLQNDIIDYWQAKRMLPNQLSDLNDPTRGILIPTDPQTKEPYTFEHSDSMSFRLCATFEKKGDGDDLYGRGQSWSHDVGPTCFDRKIDPAFYPPNDSPDSATLKVAPPVPTPVSKPIR